MAERYKDQDFYMTFVTLQVEDCLFRVPRHTLEAQSTVFRDMFSFPPPPDTEVEGSSDEHPIRLDGVAADEFRQLLKVLYPGPNGPDLRQGSEEWISVLKLSNMWQFQQVRTLALQKLPYKSVRKTAAEKVALAFQYDIEKWLLPGLNELARRQQPISVEDVQLLGLEVALKVAAVRESHVSQSPGIFGPPGAAPGPRVITGPRNARHVDFRPIIRKTFELPGALEFNGPLVLIYQKKRR
ncbi:hypothetical protein SCLCIDRAFT_25084 [Scleroderma citrinum Foug A]|uniref:BTB domain-containing protein n=1 Tax=Scleroderma citrinum Foug A TaxID=1036808 RepID=A0A0C3ABQ9_9AGAM|nr:hypothetical protein SCLCIDRAFT_25084 [Scleroderma citrinum Foug A]